MADWGINLGASTEGIRETQKKNASRSNFLSKIVPAASMYAEEKEKDLSKVRTKSYASIDNAVDATLNSAYAQSFDGKFQSVNKQDLMTALEDSDDGKAMWDAVNSSISNLPESEREQALSYAKDKLFKKNEDWVLEGSKQAAKDRNERESQIKEMELSRIGYSAESLFEAAGSEEQLITQLGDNSSDLNKRLVDLHAGVPDDMKDEVALYLDKIVIEKSGKASVAVSQRNADARNTQAVGFMINELSQLDARDPDSIIAKVDSDLKKIDGVMGGDYRAVYLEKIITMSKDTTNPLQALSALKASKHALDRPEFASVREEKMNELNKRETALREIVNNKQYNEELSVAVSVAKMGEMDTTTIDMYSGQFKPEDMNKLLSLQEEAKSSQFVNERLQGTEGKFVVTSVKADRQNEIKAVSANFNNWKPEQRKNFVGKNPDIVSDKSFEPAIRWKHSLENVITSNPNEPIDQTQMNNIREAVDLIGDNPFVLESLDKTGEFATLATLINQDRMSPDEAIRRLRSARLSEMKSDKKVVEEAAAKSLDDAVDKIDNAIFGFFGDLDDEDQEAIKADLGAMSKKLWHAGYRGDELTDKLENIARYNIVKDGNKMEYLSGVGYMINNMTKTDGKGDDFKPLTHVEKYGAERMAEQETKRWFIQNKGVNPNDANSVKQMLESEEYKSRKQDTEKEILDDGVKIKTDAYGNITFTSVYGMDGAVVHMGREKMIGFIKDGYEEARKEQEDSVQKALKSHKTKQRLLDASRTATHSQILSAKF